MKRLRNARVPIAVTRPRRSRPGERRSCEGLLFRVESMFREISCRRVFQRYQVRGRHSRDIPIDRFRRDLAGSGMTPFEMKTVESCSSLAWIQRVLFSVPSRSIRSGRNVPQPGLLRIPHSRWSTSGVAGSHSSEDSFARSVLPHQRRNSTKARMETTRAPPVASHHFARNRCFGGSLP